VLEKPSRKGRGLSRGQGIECALEKRTLVSSLVFGNKKGQGIGLLSTRQGLLSIGCCLLSIAYCLLYIVYCLLRKRQWVEPNTGRDAASGPTTRGSSVVLSWVTPELRLASPIATRGATHAAKIDSDCFFFNLPVLARRGARLLTNQLAIGD
jgi:hypothetical protein